SFAARPFDRFDDDRLPAWVETLPDRPTLYCTLGLTFSHAPQLFRTVLAAVDGLPINAIVTVGTTLQPAELGSLPANVHVAPYIPGSLILPRCHAMLFHGGFNSLHAALWHGLPLVVIPQEAGDQLPTAQLVAEHGLGIHLSEATPSAEAVRAAILRVLDEPMYASTARNLQAQMLCLPPLDDAISRLETLVRRWK
ncbi:MAG: glycosyltransferase, partial [Caldilineaceae bacterium]